MVIFTASNHRAEDTLPLFCINYLPIGDGIPEVSARKKDILVAEMKVYYKF